jgi:hypothetical protein
VPFLESAGQIYPETGLTFEAPKCVLASVIIWCRNEFLFSPASFYLLTVGELLLHLITLSKTLTRCNSSGRGIGPSKKPIYAQYTTFTRDRRPCFRAGFEPTLDRAATGIGL